MSTRSTEKDPSRSRAPQSWTEMLVLWVLACVALLGAPRLLGVEIDPVVGAAVLLTLLAGRQAIAAIADVPPPPAPPPAEPEESPPRDRRLSRLSWALHAGADGRGWREDLRPALAALVADDPDLRDDPEIARTLARDTPPTTRALTALLDRIDHP